ncbi:unnamed protein product [Amoebophrya sp. A120]|nr:unnamed protein product [Amoebophrya sp. A120]|eukprot:GSA120T00014882001.1
MSSASSSSSAHWQDQQHDRDAGREPCPDRIVEDLGGAFGMGCIGGFLWHFVRGARNSPKGERFAGAMFAATSRAPILGGNFAVWGGTFSSFDCTLQYLRKTDDHWNNIAGGFLTGGVLAARAGWKQAGKSAVMGGVILTVIEGVAALLMRSTTKTPREEALNMIEMERQQKEQADRAASGVSGGGSMTNSSLSDYLSWGRSGSTTTTPSEEGTTSSWFSSFSQIPGATTTGANGGGVENKDNSSSYFYFKDEEPLTTGPGTTAPPVGGGGAPTFQ